MIPTATTTPDSVKNPSLRVPRGPEICGIFNLFRCPPAGAQSASPAANRSGCCSMSCIATKPPSEAPTMNALLSDARLDQAFEIAYPSKQIMACLLSRNPVFVKAAGRKSKPFAPKIPRGRTCRPITSVHLAGEPEVPVQEHTHVRKRLNLHSSLPVYKPESADSLDISDHYSAEVRSLFI